MTDRIAINGIEIAASLYRFVNQEALPETECGRSRLPAHQRPFLHPPCFYSRERPNGYTETILHARRREKKATLA